ncbi:RNA polymerase sigma factor [Actinomadura rubrisoli]|uniref:RNA polymerase sigma factor n=1 Tax=Actinomadura rubrisoli TaxID=2530368 RepID=A0A4R5B7F6_9ACTN|nr:RNA polymerase sigma factor [Actinomadura rubrisoli]TDD81295.1 RNA polymerase sigma factor [Actinomadura rubrisoli]
MPRTAAHTPLTEPTSPALDELLQRGRAQGRLSLAEVRGAFEAAGISPAQGRSILRELSEAGISLAGEGDPTRRATAAANLAAEHAEGETGRAGTGTAGAPKKRAAKKTTGKPAAKTPGKTAGKAGADTAGDADDESFDVTEVEAADSPADLDDQSTTMGDSVHTYLKAIGRRQLLTADQEVELAKRIEAGLYAEHKLETEKLSPRMRADLEWVAADGRRAKAHMLEANLRLVVSVAKKYSDRGLSLLDVVQEGNLGLIRAVEKFDYSKGYKFSTYAMWWIRQAIQRGFADSARTIRLPVHVLEMLSKLSRVERDMHQRLGREPTPEELGVELDKSPEQIRELLRTSRQPISLDSTIGEDGETRIGDLIEDTDSPEAAELVDRQLMADQLRRTLDILSPREAKIMAMRFGLYDGTPRTLDEIGKALGLTRERIRQLEKESLSKLRHPSNARPLLDFAV